MTICPRYLLKYVDLNPRGFPFVTDPHLNLIQCRIPNQRTDRKRAMKPIAELLMKTKRAFIRIVYFYVSSYELRVEGAEANFITRLSMIN